MLKGREIISLPIINLSDGEYLGEVKEIITDKKGSKIRGFLIENKKWFKGAKILLWENIVSIGNDAVTVGNSDVFIDTKKNPEYGNMLQPSTSIKGLRIFSEKGRDLGVVTDFFYNKANGHLISMEISAGLVNDLFSGRREATIPEHYSIKKDSLFVGEDWVREWNK